MEKTAWSAGCEHTLTQTGAGVGLRDGCAVGFNDGLEVVGEDDGRLVTGLRVGFDVGFAEGLDHVGVLDGDRVGNDVVGDLVGNDVVGNRVGNAVGELVESSAWHVRYAVYGTHTSVAPPLAGPKSHVPGWSQPHPPPVIPAHDRPPNVKRPYQLVWLCASAPDHHPPEPYAA